jgi:hypothetical protein
VFVAHRHRHTARTGRTGTPGPSKGRTRSARTDSPSPVRREPLVGQYHLVRFFSLRCPHFHSDMPEGSVDDFPMASRASL